MYSRYLIIVNHRIFVLKTDISDCSTSSDTSPKTKALGWCNQIYTAPILSKLFVFKE